MDTPLTLLRAEARDASRAAMLRAPAHAGTSYAADADRTRICGAAPLCTLLAFAPGRRGRLLTYDRMRDDVTRSSVSWASLAFDA